MKLMRSMKFLVAISDSLTVRRGMMEGGGGGSQNVCRRRGQDSLHDAAKG